LLEFNGSSIKAGKEMEMRTKMIVALLIAGSCFVNEQVFGGIIDVLGRSPTMEKVAISPNGQKLACVKTQGDERYLLVVDLVDGMKTLRTVHIGDKKLRSIQWGDDTHVFIVNSSYERFHEFPIIGIREYFFLTVYDIVNDRQVAPVHIKSRAMAANVIFGSPLVRQVDDKTVVFAEGWAEAASDSRFVPALFKFGIGDDKASIAARDEEEANIDWQLDKDGGILGTQTYDERTRKWALNVRIDGKLKQVLSGEAQIEHPVIVGVSPNGKSLWIKMVDQNLNDTVYRSISLQDGVIMNCQPRLIRLSTSGIIVTPTRSLAV